MVKVPRNTAELPIDGGASRLRQMSAPRKTNEKSRTGRPIWLSPSGEKYSERTASFSIGNTWYTFPTIDKRGYEMSEDQIRDYIMREGPVDPITGEKFPTFKTMKEAIDYAKQRSPSLLPKRK